MLRVFFTKDTVINVDNDLDAAKLLLSDYVTGEMSQDDIQAIFGELVCFAGPDNTTVLADGTVEFDRNKALADDLTAKKLSASQAVVDAQTQAVVDGVEYLGVTYQCRKKDVLNLTRGLNTLELSGVGTTEVRALDNSWHTLTLEQFTELCTLVSVSFQTAWRDSYRIIDGNT